MTSPDPVPLWVPFFAEIVTTEGMTLSATPGTAHTLSPDALGGAALDAVLAVVLAEEELIAAPIKPPARPPTTRAPPRAAQGTHPGRFRACFDSLISAPPFARRRRLNSTGAGRNIPHPPWGTWYTLPDTSRRHQPVSGDAWRPCRGHARIETA